MTEKLIFRDRLIKRVLSAAPACRLTFIVSPAGFGKSKLLAQIADHFRASGWWIASLICQSGDHEPDTLFKRVQSSLNDARLVSDRAEASLSGLADQIRSLGAKGAVLIDEFEMVASTANEQLLLSLAQLLPFGCRVIVATRDAPRNSRTRLQLQGLIDIVDSQELRFSTAEALELLADVMPAEESAKHAASAEGWPLILQLMRIRAHHRKSSSQSLQSFVPGFEIFEYLAAEVFAALDDETREFLTDVSLLAVVEPAVANAIRGREDSGKYILRLASLRPIVSVDQQPLQARLHPLFRDFLQSLLQRAGGERIRTLHERAAKHLASSERTYLAVEHAILAGNTMLAAELVEAAASGYRLHLCESTDVCLRLLQLLPRDTVRSRPRLRVLRIMQLVKEGYIEEAIHDFRELLRSIRAGADDDSELKREIALVQPMIEAFESEHTLERSGAVNLDAVIAEARADRFIDPRPLIWGLATDSYLLHRYGPFDRATRRSKEITQYLESEQLKYWIPDGYVHLALIALGNAQFPDAEQLLRKALRQRVEIFGDASSNVCLHANALLGKLYYLQNSLDTAMAHFEAIPPGRWVLSAHLPEGVDVYRARIEYARGNSAKALVLLQTARSAAVADRMVHVSNSLAAARIELLCALGQRQSAGELAAEINLPHLWDLACKAFSLPWQEVELLARAILRTRVKIT